MDKQEDHTAPEPSNEEYLLATRSLEWYSVERQPESGKGI